MNSPCGFSSGEVVARVLISFFHRTKRIVGECGEEPTCEIHIEGSRPRKKKEESRGDQTVEDMQGDSGDSGDAWKR